MSLFTAFYSNTSTMCELLCPWVTSPYGTERQTDKVLYEDLLWEGGLHNRPNLSKEDEFYRANRQTLAAVVDVRLYKTETRLLMLGFSVRHLRSGLDHCRRTTPSSYPNSCTHSPSHSFRQRSSNSVYFVQRRNWPHPVRSPGDLRRRGSAPVDPGNITTNSVVTCEMKLFWNNFDIISVFYFARNHVWNYFKIISATLNMLENIHELQWPISLRNNFEIITRTWLRYVRVFAVAIPSVCLSVTLVHPTQGVEAFGKISSPLCTLAILWPPCKILRR